MNDKDIWKIRLRPDGTWENVYRSDFYELDTDGLIAMSRGDFKDPTKELVAELEAMRDNYIEQALECGDLKEAKEVIEWIKKKS